VDYLDAPAKQNQPIQLKKIDDYHGDVVLLAGNEELHQLAECSFETVSSAVIGAC
jgi:hypothetical protein